MPWETRCFGELSHLSAAFETNHFVILNGVLGAMALGASSGVICGARTVPSPSAFCIAWRVWNTSRREDAISIVVIEADVAWVCTISAAISSSFLVMLEPSIFVVVLAM